ncbi:uncharacterized protein LOC136018988 isoform X2 [Lathamus discolor]|uniref:uncharacterized protein LOC136018988 isoform X2 n=1 Tax=Lathamus discolor TaxID=678569 RepID=UPI0032B78BC5
MAERRALRGGSEGCSAVWARLAGARVLSSGCAASRRGPVPRLRHGARPLRAAPEPVWPRGGCWPYRAVTAPIREAAGGSWRPLRRRPSFRPVAWPAAAARSATAQRGKAPGPGRAGTAWEGEGHEGPARGAPAALGQGDPCSSAEQPAAGALPPAAKEEGKVTVTAWFCCYYLSSFLVTLNCVIYKLVTPFVDPTVFTAAVGGVSPTIRLLGFW